MQELELLDLLARLERDRLPHALATVVSVHGSASAKPGSKMLVSAEGKNLWGWVGGGCAESFTISEALEALKEGLPRTITADLDDEVFGLGMPCGGKMEIFVEPRLPPEHLSFATGSAQLAQLASFLGFEAKIAAKGDQSNAEALRSLVTALARSRGKEPSYRPLQSVPSELLILGHSRITEKLATLAALLGWPVRVYGLFADPAAYPSTVTVQTAAAEYAGLEVKKDSYVVVASHHKGDHEYIAAALAAGAAYVGMIASRKRAGLVLEHLRAQGVTGLERVDAPAGLDIQSRNPIEIALSVLGLLLGP